MADIKFWADFMRYMRQCGGDVVSGKSIAPWTPTSRVATVRLPDGNKIDLLYSIWQNKRWASQNADQEVINLFLKYESRWHK